MDIDKYVRLQIKHANSTNVCFWGFFSLTVEMHSSVGTRVVAT